MGSNLENLWLPRTVESATDGGSESGSRTRHGSGGTGGVARRRLVVARAGGERFAMAFSSRERASTAMASLAVPMVDVILCCRGNQEDVYRQLDTSACVGVLVDYDPATGEAVSAIRRGPLARSRIRRAS